MPDKATEEYGRLLSELCELYKQQEDEANDLESRLAAAEGVEQEVLRGRLKTKNGSTKCLRLVLQGHREALDKFKLRYVRRPLIGKQPDWDKEVPHNDLVRGGEF